MHRTSATILCLSGLLSPLSALAGPYVCPVDVTCVYTQSNISVGTIQATADAGTLSFYGDQPADADVRAGSLAKNSLGESSADSDAQNAYVDLDKTSAVTWANGHGYSKYSTGIVGADSKVFIPPHEKMRWAYGEGVGSLGRWFQITGGSGSTSATLSIPYSGQLYGSAGADSYFTTQIIAGFELFQWSDIDQSLTQLDKKTQLYTLSGGPSETKGPIDQSSTLGGTYTLNFDTWYYAYYEGDSETSGRVPEPGPLYLMLSGFALGARRPRRARIAC